MKIYFSSKSNKTNTFRINAYVNLRYLARFFLGSEKCDKQVVEKIRTQMSGQRRFSDNRIVYEIIIQKYSTARHATNDKKKYMAQKD